MRRLCLLSVLVSLTGCKDSVDGELLVTRVDGSVFAFEPNDCASGEPLEFFGVDMWDGSDNVLRFMHFPEDGPVLVFMPDDAPDASFDVVPDACREFGGELKRTNSQTNGVWEMRGDITLDCDAPSGERVEGWLEFEDCADLNNDYSE